MTAYPSDDGVQRYGALTVVGFADTRTAKIAICRCSCSRILSVGIESLRDGSRQACGSCAAKPHSDSFASSLGDSERSATRVRHRGRV
jgi:hypothetical protein